MKLFLVRHGQTDWNLAQRFQGYSDVPLNGVGRQQAVALKNRLSGQIIDCIYSSDLQRASETARVISNGKIEMRIDSRLREMNFGLWEGLTYNEVKEKYTDALSVWESDLYQNSPMDGETLEQLARRVQSMLNDLCEKHVDQTVLVVAHGGVLQTLVCLALNLSPAMYWQFGISPASLSEVSFYPAGAIVNLLNDSSYLGDIL
jgi:alpha-ribazole phosphatase